MSEPCMIDGQRCSKCCETPMLKYRRPDLVGMNPPAHSDAAFILENWKPISRRRAKKANSFLLSRPGTAGMHFWRCTRLGARGCTVYSTRPDVCRGYPHYGDLDRVEACKGTTPEYHPDCTEWGLVRFKEDGT